MQRWHQPLLQKIVMTYSIKVFEFTAAVHGYHHYRKFWKQEHQQVLNSYHEKNNAFDRFAIIVPKIGNDEKPVGHLPMEIWRATKFFNDQGANLRAELASDHYMRSLLIQGGMKTPCKITAKISRTVINLLLMEKYIQLVKELYTEPKSEEILGYYLHAEANGVDLPIPLPRNASVPRRRKTLSDVQMKNIRNFFNRNQTQRSNQGRMLR